MYLHVNVFAYIDLSSLLLNSVKGMFWSCVLPDSVSAVYIVVYSCVTMFMFEDDCESVQRLVPLVVVDVVGDGCKLSVGGFFGTLNFVVTSSGCAFGFGELVLCSYSVRDLLVSVCPFDNHP